MRECDLPGFGSSDQLQQNLKLTIKPTAWRLMNPRARAGLVLAVKSLLTLDPEGVYQHDYDAPEEPTPYPEEDNA